MSAELEHFKINNYKVFTDTNEVQFEKETIRLSPKEMSVLEVLYQNRGTTVTRSILLEQVWNDEYGNNLGLTQAISKLRQVFNDNSKEPKLIKTIPKKGYQLIIEPRRVEHPRLKKTDLYAKYTKLSFVEKIGVRLILILGLIFVLMLFFDISIRVEQALP